MSGWAQGCYARFGRWQGADRCWFGSALPAEVVLGLHVVAVRCTATGWWDRGHRETTRRAEGISVDNWVTLWAWHVMTSHRWTGGHHRGGGFGGVAKSDSMSTTDSRWRPLTDRTHGVVVPPGATGLPRIER